MEINNLEENIEIEFINFFRLESSTRTVFESLQTTKDKEVPENLIHRNLLGRFEIDDSILKFYYSNTKDLNYRFRI